MEARVEFHLVPTEADVQLPACFFVVVCDEVLVTRRRELDVGYPETTRTLLVHGAREDGIEHGVELLPHVLDDDRLWFWWWWWWWWWCAGLVATRMEQTAHAYARDMHAPPLEMAFSTFLIQFLCVSCTTCALCWFHPCVSRSKLLICTYMRPHHRLTCSPWLASFCRSHLIPCPCGSMMSGQRLQLQMTAPFSTDTRSADVVYQNICISDQIIPSKQPHKRHDFLPGRPSRTICAVCPSLVSIPRGSHPGVVGIPRARRSGAHTSFQSWRRVSCWWF